MSDWKIYEAGFLKQSLALCIFLIEQTANADLTVQAKLGF